MVDPTLKRRRYVRCLLLACLGFASCGVSGCASFGPDPSVEIDAGLVARARARLQADLSVPDFDLPPEDEWDETDRRRRGNIGEAILGEVIAIVPGLILPGLGHMYAGDRRTGSQLMRVGGTGIVLTALGGGVALGGYAIDQDDDLPSGLAYGLYGTGGLVGVIGLAYYLTAYIYDVADTPRAVLTGRPPRRSPFVESLDMFDH